MTQQTLVMYFRHVVYFLIGFFLIINKGLVNVYS